VKRARILNLQGIERTSSKVEGGFMIAKVVDALFGCRHSRYSFPVTVRRAARRPQAAALTGTYVVCLDCGKEFAYDWQEMKVITSPERHREHLAELAKHAA
jgi:RNA polymerase subunit RPABC4/transcription elongation factor Spt4